jgi:uncharacterized protein YhaN
MRISDLDIKAYGLFVDYPLSDLAEGLVVFHGANEAGKTTLFNALTSLLYGFYPASSDFPYRSWHTDKYPELRAILLLKDGSRAEVGRRLTSSPQGTLTYKGETTQLANRDLPFVQHVNMDLYKALYALTQSNARSLQESEQHEIEERLLGDMGADVLRSTRESVAELEDKASRLWRPDNRGKPLYKELQQHLKEVRIRRRQAVEKDETIRQKYEQLAKVQGEMQELREKKLRLSSQVRRADVLLPLKKKLQQIEVWRREVKDFSVVESLPDAIRAEYHRLCGVVKEREQTIENLRRDRQVLKKTQEEFAEDDRTLLAEANRLDKWIRQFSAHQQEHRSLEDLQRKETRLKEMLSETAQAILAHSWTDELLPKVESIILPDLKARILDYTEKREEARRKAAARENITVVKVAGQLPRWTAWGIIAVGLIMLMFRLLDSFSWLLTVGIVLNFIGGAMILYNAYLSRQRTLLEQQQKEQRSALEKSLRRAESDAEEAKRLVAEILRDLHIASAVLERPDLAFYQAVERLRSATVEYRQVSAEHQEREQKWNEQQQNLGELTEDLGESEPTPEALSRLEQRLTTAKDRRHNFDDAEKRIGEIDRALQTEQERLNDAEQERKGLLKHVAEAIGNELSPDEALDRATGLQAIAQKIRDAERQLEQDYPELPELQEEIRRSESTGEEAWVLDSEEVERHRDEIETIMKQLESLSREEGQLQRDIENARDDVSVGELDGEIARIEEEMLDVQVHRDRLALLSVILREADRIFREKHQPDVLKRASEYLSKITNNRYTMLTRVTDDEGYERLEVKTKDVEYRPIEAPLSSGILDQIYLAFRLAVISHLDENHEPLPLFLDEALINWDDVRFDRGLEILQDVVQQRQVFVFTCHDWIAERLQSLPEASLHTLPAVD